jgi:hypothetical protein
MDWVRPVIVFRGLLVVFSIIVAVMDLLPVITGSAWNNNQHPVVAFAYAGIAGLLIPFGIPSLIIVFGLRARRRWAVITALAFDLAVLGGVTAALILMVLSAIVSIIIAPYPVSFSTGPNFVLGTACALILVSGFVWEEVYLRGKLKMKRLVVG